jgi:YHS domain-containing protein
MNKRIKKLIMTMMPMLLLTVGLIAVDGCKKSEPASSETVAKKAAEVTSTEAEQTTCPVMDGNPINKDLFTEYKGKKVYFCCPGCETKFKEDPEKYISKLPQFQK